MVLDIHTSMCIRLADSLHREASLGPSPVTVADSYHVQVLSTPSPSSFSSCSDAQSSRYSAQLASPLPGPLCHSQWTIAAASNFASLPQPSFPSVSALRGRIDSTRSPASPLPAVLLWPTCLQGP